jgi:signal transduction histidine kinase
VVAVAPVPGVAVPVTWISAVFYALGFVALLDLLARYPTGGYAWPSVRAVVRAVGAVAVVVATLLVLGSPRTPSVLELDAGINPVHIPALAGLASAVFAVVLLPVLGFVLLVARYPGAAARERAQMRWPIATAGVVAVGLVTSGVAEELLGPQTQSALFVAAGVALPASFLIGMLRHTEETDRLAALQASRARLAEVADAERRRIERDLHDGAQQQILALLARVELARTGLGDGSGGVDQELRGIADELRAVHRDLRELARGVHPAVLSDHGVAEAVRSALGRLPFPVELEVSPEVDGQRYARTVEGAAYFLVLEGLANAIKHAGTTRVRVTLSRHGDLLEVAVSDAGRGFGQPPEDASGLTGLRDRLAAVGGSLEVDSRPGFGTTLRGLLPVHGHAAG